MLCFLGQETLWQPKRSVPWPSIFLRDCMYMQIADIDELESALLSISRPANERTRLTQPMIMSLHIMYILVCMEHVNSTPNPL